MDKNTIGKSLRLYRKANNLSQESLGNKLYMKRQTISAYENGLILPSIYTLCMIADVYHISVDELIGRK